MRWTFAGICRDQAMSSQVRISYYGQKENAPIEGAWLYLTCVSKYCKNNWLNTLETGNLFSKWELVCVRI